MKPTFRLTLGLAALLALAACAQQADTSPSPAERAARAGKEAQAKAEAQSKAQSKAAKAENRTDGNNQASGSTPAGTPSLDRVKALVQGASQGRTRAVSVFEGPDGLTGVITVENQNNVKGVIFTNAAGTVVLPTVIGENGENLIDKAMTDQQVYAKPEDILTRASVASAKPILFGKSGPILTVFMDPNCYYCHKMFQDFQASVKAGKLRMRFVMLGFLKPDSMAKAATIVSAKDPLAELSKDEMEFDEKTESGATVVPATPDKDGLAAVTANTQLLGELGPVSTPGLLYCMNNKVVFARGAMPLDTVLPQLSTEGHAACK